MERVNHDLLEFINANHQSAVRTSRAGLIKYAHGFLACGSRPVFQRFLGGAALLAQEAWMQPAASVDNQQGIAAPHQLSRERACAAEQGLDSEAGHRAGDTFASTKLHAPGRRLRARLSGAQPVRSRIDSGAPGAGLHARAASAVPRAGGRSALEPATP